MFGTDFLGSSKGAKSLKGERLMKKVLLAVFLVMAVVLVHQYAGAAAGGVCSNCHTMHDSQGGADQGITGAQAYLLLNDCYGCHSTGGPAGAPKIDGTGGAGTDATAGGDVDAGTVAQRHDVLAADVFAMNPPGWNVGTWTVSAKVSCEGAVTGCHGSHVSGSEGVAGMHHATTIPYRMLISAAGNVGAGTDIVGKGSADWELGGATATNHNVYRADGTGGTGISEFCKNCHGLFHETSKAGGASSSAFERHPTDVALPAAWTEAIDYDATPFAFTSTAADWAAVTTTAAYPAEGTLTDGYRVACVSCHRSHGNAANDMLRFTYSSMNAGNATNNGGCENCHSAQR
jgi:hypothetical protein